MSSSSLGLGLKPNLETAASSTSLGYDLNSNTLYNSSYNKAVKKSNDKDKGKKKKEKGKVEDIKGLVLTEKEEEAIAAETDPELRDKKRKLCYCRAESRVHKQRSNDKCKEAKQYAKDISSYRTTKLLLEKTKKSMEIDINKREEKPRVVGEISISGTGKGDQVNLKDEGEDVESSSDLDDE